MSKTGRPFASRLGWAMLQQRAVESFFLAGPLEADVQYRRLKVSGLA